MDTFLLLLSLWGLTNAQDSSNPPSISYNFAQGGADWKGLCASGQNQAPIDIHPELTEQVADPDFSPVWIDIPPQNMTELVVEMPLFMANGSLQAVFNSTQYQQNLIETHFHIPSEHLIDGIRYPLELHLSFIPIDSNDTVHGMVIAVLFQEGDNSYLVDTYLQRSIIDYTTLISSPIDDYFFYSGGREVPAPDCDEPIFYIVPNQVFEVGTEQIQALQDGLYAGVIADSGTHGQYRDAQPLNGRTVYHRVAASESFLLTLSV